MKAVVILVLSALTGVWSAGCGSSNKNKNSTPTPVATATSTAVPTATPQAQCFDTTLGEDLCDPAVVSFTLESTNRYYPLQVGLRTVLEGEEDGEVVRVEREVLDETETVAGVETHVLEHREYVDGEILEIARNFYVESEDGTVCYFGEDVDFFENGVLVDHHGSWRAGVDGSKPGIIMPAEPVVGQSYFQENAPGIAHDMGRVVVVEETVTVDGETYDDAVVVFDSNPLDDCDGEEEKVYVPGIGEVVDDVLELISFSPAQCFDTTLDVSLCDPDVATFTLDSTNPYYPLKVGLQTILEGEEDGELIRVERTVLADTMTVAGVETHVLEHKQFIDDQIHEIARNFYVEASDGTVCYFGEDVEFFEDGVLVNTGGTWRAGVDGAKPGIIMPAAPMVGQAYFQEAAPRIATDMGRVSATDETFTVLGQTYTDVVVIQDSNPMEDCDDEEEKVYVAGIGEVVDAVIELISFTPAP